MRILINVRMLYLHHKTAKEDIVMKRITTETTTTMRKRLLSIICIAGMIALTGTATACTSDTAATTENSYAGAGDADSSAVSETDNSSAAGQTSADDTAGTSAADGSTDTSAADTADGISLEDAKAIALKDAGLEASDVTYTAEGQDTDHGVAVYEIDFYTETTEYDYEIRISDGNILEKSTEAFQAGGAGTTDTSSESCISVDEAKSIVLNQAGLSASDVTFRKAMLERDDGVMVYEIEFYCGRTEYEYTVNAVSGAILEYDMETE